MRLAERVTFGGGAVDRAAELRGDRDRLHEMWLSPGAMTLPLWRGKPLVAPGGLGWLACREDVVVERFNEAALLGLIEGAPRFATDLSDWMPDEVPEGLDGFSDLSEQHHPGLPDDHVFAELRREMTRLSPTEAELAATAKALKGWHLSHRFCACCGAESVPAQAGWQRDCPACGAHHFPRTDPVVIMLITQGNAVLVGRSPAWPEDMYSLLAGFVEPGETVEAAVRREVFEETCIRVGAVRYLASQPWPFPSSLMLGCRGDAESTEITIDPHELEDARWITREELLSVLAGESDTIKPAREGAIARALLTMWLADEVE